MSPKILEVIATTNKVCGSPIEITHRGSITHQIGTMVCDPSGHRTWIRSKGLPGWHRAGIRARRKRPIRRHRAIKLSMKSLVGSRQSRPFFHNTIGTEPHSWSRRGIGRRPSRSRIRRGRCCNNRRIQKQKLLPRNLFAMTTFKSPEIHGYPPLQASPQNDAPRPGMRTSRKYIIDFQTPSSCVWRYLQREKPGVSAPHRLFYRA